MKGNQNYLERISLALALISLFLTIYFSKNEFFQIIFVSAFVTFSLAYFIFRNSILIRANKEQVRDFNQRLTKIENSLEIYNRLNKLEKEVFKK
tara:strand:- start:40 stop:321 length:282 start_codon:yes stop_codon:yes gene_type:complete